jgi:hypothetical protein
MAVLRQYSQSKNENQEEKATLSGRNHSNGHTSLQTEKGNHIYFTAVISLTPNCLGPEIIAT